METDHATGWRWVQRYGPELDKRLRRHLKPTNKSWRVDETFVKVKGRSCYLYRAIDSAGATIDFLLICSHRSLVACHPAPELKLYQLNISERGFCPREYFEQNALWIGSEARRYAEP